MRTHTYERQRDNRKITFFFLLYILGVKICVSTRQEKNTNFVGEEINGGNLVDASERKQGKTE